MLLITSAIIPLLWASSSCAALFHARTLAQKPNIRAYEEVNQSPLSEDYEQHSFQDYPNHVELDGDASSIAAGHKATLPIHMKSLFGFPYFTTNIALGTPNQPLRVVLDLSYNSLLVRSSNCHTFGCQVGRDLLSYNDTMSSSYESKHKNFTFVAAGTSWEGYLSQDVMHLLNLGMESTVFGEITGMWSENIGVIAMADSNDGYLGLAPANPSCQTYLGKDLPNPMSSIMSGFPRDQQTMSIRIPRFLNETGQLSFGETEDAARSNETIRLPLTNATGYWLNDTWQVSTQRISLGDGSQFNLTLNNTYARFDLDLGIGLPPDILALVYEAIGARYNDYVPGGVVDCKTRGQLPDVVVSLTGHDFVITKDDYSVRAFWRDGTEVCFVNIHETFRSEPSFIVLGTTFMKKYQTIFDAGKREIDCELYDPTTVQENVEIDSG